MVGQREGPLLMIGKQVFVLRFMILLASIPALLFAFLGLFSRMMADDYGLFATALRLGGRINFSYWWENHFGSYTFILLNDLVAPLGAVYVPAIVPRGR